MIQENLKNLTLNLKINLSNLMLGMAPQDGFEPPAKRLTVACSTAELLGNKLIYTLLYISCNNLNISY